MTEQDAGAGTVPVATGGTAHQAQRAPGAGTIALLALVWLLATLSSARFTIGDSPQLTPVTITRLGLELPQVVAASLVAGVGVGLAATGLVGRFAASVLARRLRRTVISATAGLLLGASLGASIVLGYRDLPMIGSLGWTVAAAGLLGGLLAGVVHRTVIAAGVVGVLGVFAVRFVAGLVDADLRSLFGAEDTAASVLTASNWVVLTGAVVAGTAGGALCYAYLRRSGSALGWLRYLLAGALPGVFTLLSELVTQVGGNRLFQLIAQVSADDQVVLQFLTVTRFNQALVVLFAGGLTALLLLGRTLRAPEADRPELPGADTVDLPGAPTPSPPRDDSPGGQPSS